MGKEAFEIIEGSSLAQALDRGIDDMEAGRVLPLDEAFKLVDELVARRKATRSAWSYE